MIYFGGGFNNNNTNNNVIIIVVYTIEPMCVYNICIYMYVCMYMYIMYVRTNVDVCASGFT